MKKLAWILVFIVLAFQGFCQSTEVLFTLEDRDRIIKIEEKLNSLDTELNTKIESLRNEMNAKFDAVDHRFEAVDSKIDIMFWGLGIVIALMLFLMGYIFWDRKTALHPIQKKTNEHEEKFRKLEYIAKTHAKKDPSFAELLKIAGLL